MPSSPGAVVRSPLADAHSLEIASGERFAFGRNWSRFLRVVNEDRIRHAERSLVEMIGADAIAGRTFLDVGCGSGLFSLAAARLGARRVHSLDYDPQSVACARELKRRYLPDHSAWTIEPGSVLDRAYLTTLDRWDIVYSWGVLHHTGAMWQALDNVAALVAPGGLLFVSIYNDQGWQSRAWTTVKRWYNRHALARAAIVILFVPAFALLSFAVDLVRRRNPFTRYRGSARGMSAFYDWLDWLGGYPFEVASADALVAFFRGRGFEPRRLVSVGRRLGCNELVCGRPVSASANAPS